MTLCAPRPMVSETDATAASSQPRPSMMRTRPVDGCVILDRAGEFVAWSSCIVAALRRYKADPLCDRIESCATGGVLAYKRRAARTKGWKHRFEESVAA